MSPDLNPPQQQAPSHTAAMSGKGVGKETSSLVPRGAGSRAASNAPTGTVGPRRRAPAGEAWSRRQDRAVLHREQQQQLQGMQSSDSPPHPQQNNIAGSSRKMSQNVMNFYTDDSPGLKISPVSAAGPSRPWMRLYYAVGSCRQAQAWGNGLDVNGCLQDCDLRPLRPGPLQVLVIGMSLGFILFVTILHFVGKVGSAAGPGRGVDCGTVVGQQWHWHWHCHAAAGS